LHHDSDDKTRKDFLAEDIFVPVTVIFIITGLTVFERRQTEILTTFGHWIGFGGLDGRRLQKKGNSYCTFIAIRKSVTLDGPADWPSIPRGKDTSLQLFVKIDKKSGLAVHIRNKGDWQCISEWCAIQSDMTENRPRLGREPDCTAEIANVSRGQNLRGSGK
jgi:hypothetical protein